MEKTFDFEEIKFINDNIDLNSATQNFELSQCHVTDLRKFRQSVSSHLGTPFYTLPLNWVKKNVDWLCKKHIKSIHFWYKEGLLDVFYYSSILANCPTNTFLLWWDPDKFDWYNYSHILVCKQKSNLGIWWDADKLNYGISLFYLFSHEYPIDLIWNEESLNRSNIQSYNIPLILSACHQKKPSIMNSFRVWWPFFKNILKNDSSSYSRCVAHLSYIFSKEFDIWWIKGVVDYSDPLAVYNLLAYCHSNFEEWWSDDILKNPKVLSRCIAFLPMYYSENFDRWYGKEFNKVRNCRNKQYKKLDISIYNIEFLLIKHCSDHFDKWWDLRRVKPFYGKRFFQELEKHCSLYYDRWAPEYVIYKLKQEGS